MYGSYTSISESLLYGAYINLDFSNDLNPRFYILSEKIVVIYKQDYTSLGGIRLIF